MAFRSSHLFTETVKLLNGNEELLEQFRKNVNTSNVSALVPCFTYLDHWIKSQLHDEIEQKNYKVLKIASQVVWIVKQKIPPIYALLEAEGISSDKYFDNYIYNGFFSALASRINELRSFFAISTHVGIVTLYKGFEDIIDNDNMSTFQPLHLETDIDLAMNSTSIAFFRRMILNRAQIESFKPYLDRRNSTSYLTKALISILDDINNERNSTQEELMIQFSTTFLYINGFTQMNFFDGHLFIDYLQTISYISPFFLLALVSHIPKTVYLFSILAPKYLSDSIDPGSLRFNILDRAINKKLSTLTAQVPRILADYFQDNPGIHSTVYLTDIVTDDSEFFLQIHNPDQPVFEKMKFILNVARNRTTNPISFWQVSGIPIVLHRYIFYSLQQTFDDCIKSNLLTDNFILFMRSIINFMSPCLVDMIHHSFFKIKLNEPQHTLMILKMLYSICIPSILHKQTNDIVYRFAIETSFTTQTSRISRLLLSRLFMLSYIRMSNQLPTIFKEITDISIGLEFLVAFSKNEIGISYQLVSAYREYKKTLDEVLDVEYETDLEMIFISKFNPKPTFNQHSLTLMELFNKMNIRMSLHDIIPRDETKGAFIRILILSKYIRWTDVVEGLIAELFAMETGPNRDDHQAFPIGDACYPFAKESGKTWIHITRRKDA